MTLREIHENIRAVLYQTGDATDMTQDQFADTGEMIKRSKQNNKGEKHV
jgi:hypothetical protein